MSATDKTEFIIRKAEVKDMREVYQMIKELSDFEKMSHKIKIDQETLERDFAENSPSFQCIVAEKPEGPLIGYAIYCQIYSSWDGKAVYLEDLYVKPDYRRKGVGKMITATAVRSAYEAGCRTVYLNIQSWNLPAIAFYEELGAFNLTQKTQYQICVMESESLLEITKSL